jgi:hypothetical protein
MQASKPVVKKDGGVVGRESEQYHPNVSVGKSLNELTEMAPFTGGIQVSPSKIDGSRSKRWIASIRSACADDSNFGYRVAKGSLRW